MDHEQSLDEAVEAARRRRFPPNAPYTPWDQLLPAQQVVWRKEFFKTAREREAQRQQFALQIAVAAASRVQLITATAEDQGKLTARFALAAADKILE